ncbi:hypothetical protein BGX34_006459 [Mortierella sp. NVP85]|nr:hypothetical protein BGX34_006459 [Mortierella sp. NVP85]
MDDSTGSLEHQHQQQPETHHIEQQDTTQHSQPQESEDYSMKPTEANVIDIFEAVETASTVQLEQFLQESQGEVPSKRLLPDDADYASQGSSQSSVQISSQPQPNPEDAAGPGSPSSSSKKRRISMPGKSILKSSQDDTGDHTDDHEIPNDSVTGDAGGLTPDVTETFSSTADFTKRSRKSISRRVSFAATARIRMFERDDREDELPKTTSYLEGINAREILSAPFTFESSDKDNTNETNDSTGSTGTGVNSPHGEHSSMSLESSDSERERSFEVNVHSSHSDSTGSSGSGIPFFMPTSDADHSKTPFDDGDADNGISSDEDNSHFFPDPSLMKRSSGVAIFEGEKDSILGPQIELGPQTTGTHLTSQISNPEDDTQDFSMEYRFQSHRSSLPERLLEPPLPSRQQDVRVLMGSQQGNTNEAEVLSTNSATLEADNNHLNELLSVGSSLNLLSQDDILNEHLDLAMDMDMDLTGDYTRDDRAGDEDTDMDITAPIGGINGLGQEQDLANELPPTGFHNAQDTTAIFSDIGTPMDITQPIGGILESLDEPATVNGSQLDDNIFHSVNIPPTPVLSTQSQILYGLDSSQSSEQPSQNGHQGDKGNHLRSEPPQTGPTPGRPSSPPTPSRRQRGASFHGNEVTPLFFPRRSLGTPGQTTPSVKARLNIFPEVLERQLQTLESSAPTEPETSNLAKRLYRYSVGTYTRASGGFQERLSRANEDDSPSRTGEDRDDTRDMSAQEKLTSNGRPANDSFNERPSLVGEDLSGLNSTDGQAERAQDRRIQGRQQETANGDYESGEDDDSFTELPPITLNKFLSLIGISFLDHLNASTRRRTLPHQTSASDGSEATYRIEDLIKAMAVSAPVLNSYNEACQLMNQSMSQSRAFIDGVEKRINQSNPDYFREFRESNVDTKEFMKDRFKMIKVHSKLEANARFSEWKTEVLNIQRHSLEQHLVELRNDIENLAVLKTALAEETAKVAPRRRELRLEVEKATERQRSYELCDKDRLASLAEAAEEQGGQIEVRQSRKAEKAKELADLRARVQKLRQIEQAENVRITAAEKTIQDHQYARSEDLNRARDMLNIIQATHRWEPLQSASSSSSALQTGKPLEFVYDRTLKVAIDITKVGKTLDAVQVTEFEESQAEENMMDIEHFSANKRLSISALAPRKRKDIKEYASLLRDYTGMVASKYIPGTTIGKILSDISQFWSKICSIRREIELVRAHHRVDLVAGSAENLRELENNATNGTKQVAGPTPLVVLDVRVRFTGTIRGTQKTPGEQVKFYLWFTFTLSDLLTFPGPNSFTWRLEIVYGNMSHDHVSRAIGPLAKKGGYDVLREICLNVRQLVRT